MLKLGNVPTLFNIAAFHAERSIDQVQTWARELQLVLGSAFRQLEESAESTRSDLTATTALSPAAYGMFLANGSGGFTARTSYGPRGKLTGADSGVSISGTTAVVSFTAMGFALGDPDGACIVLSPYHNLGNTRVINEISGSRTASQIAIRCRDVSNNVVSFGTAAVGACFAVYRTT